MIPKSTLILIDTLRDSSSEIPPNSPRLTLTNSGITGTKERRRRRLYYGSSRLRPKICQTPPRTSLGTVGIREFMSMLTVPQTTVAMMMNRMRKVTTVRHALLIVPSTHPGLRAAGLCALSQGPPSRLGKVNPGAQQLRGAIGLHFSVVFARIHAMWRSWRRCSTCRSR